MDSRFRSAAGGALVHGRYRAMLDAWPVPHTERRIPTSQGETFVLECGPGGRAARRAVARRRFDFRAVGAQRGPLEQHASAHRHRPRRRARLQRAEPPIILFRRARALARRCVGRTAPVRGVRRRRLPGRPGGDRLCGAAAGPRSPARPALPRGHRIDARAISADGRALVLSRRPRTTQDARSRARIATRGTHAARRGIPGVRRARAGAPSNAHAAVAQVSRRAAATADDARARHRGSQRHRVQRGRRAAAARGPRPLS